MSKLLKAIKDYKKKRELKRHKFYGKEDYIKNVCNGIEPKWSDKDKTIMKIIELTKTGKIQWEQNHKDISISDGRMYEADCEHTHVILKASYGWGHYDLEQLTNYGERTIVKLTNLETGNTTELHVEEPYFDTCLFVDLNDVVSNQCWERSFNAEMAKRKEVYDTFCKDLNNKE